MALGGWLLLNSLGIVRISVWQLFWPMILIAIGTVLVVQTVRRRGDSASGTDTADTLTIFAVLSGVKRTSTAARFRGGEITLVHGRRPHRSAPGDDSPRGGGGARRLRRDGRL